MTAAYHIIGLNKRNPCVPFRRIVLLCVFFTHSVSALYAQEETDYMVHANIIFHFTKYIDWPASSKAGNFIIGVIGESELYDALKTSLDNKKVGTQEIEIQRIKSSSSEFNCHILFIGDGESGNIKKIVAKTADNPILLVSESAGLARKGSCINFAVVWDRLKLEINKVNIEKRKLKIASDLLKLGKIVN